MKRGQIWTAAGGVYASKPRPVLIIQDDYFGATSSVVVIPMTTTDVDAPFARVPVHATATTGVAKDSFAMVDKVTTVRRSSLGEHVGRATSAEMVEVERALLVFLGIAG
ncbi:MAG TPA: type II toxin-antitoxin system PemK/MazF family toxin [Dermatophilaceae bacterium]|nr:type II toxin-antitoxin system PemK/MazF family toxin [Dermatophilaceae bacterium]